MDNKRAKIAKSEKERQEDVALNRALLWVAAAVILEGLLMLVNRFYVNFYTDEVSIAVAISVMLRVFGVAGLVAFVAGIVWYRWAKGKEKPTLPPAAVLVGGLLVAAFCAILWVFYSSGVTLLFALIPAMAVLALVYYLYQRECFLTIALTGVAIFGMWLVRRGSAGPYAGLIRGYLILAAVLAVLALAALAALRGKQGVLAVKGKELQLLPKKANYPLLAATCIIVLAALVAAVALGAALSYYLIFVLITWAFILLVYYTVQLL
jgi:hypothetical protein